MNVRMKTGLLTILCLLMAMGGLLAQDDRSHADVLYFEYHYKDAISEYLKEQQKGPLSYQQQLNLAASYLKTGDYEKASNTYVDVFKRDSTMSVNQYNNMFRAIARTSGIDRVKAFLSTRENAFSKEMLENAEFNFELLEREEDAGAPSMLFALGCNSPQSDFAPAFYGDRLLFTSARALKNKQIYEPSGESYLDIYVARMGANGEVLNANPFTEIPESKYHEATPYFSSTLQQLFFIRSNTEEGKLVFSDQGKNTLAIGQADAFGNFNYLLRDLGTSFYYPYYNSKAERLYFAAELEDSYGGTDIYFVHTNNGLIMSAPINLGPRINTPGNEIAPYMIDNTFYYSSDVFYGLGGMDIYKATVQKDGSFSIPVNLGRGFNTPQDDFGLIIRKDAGGDYMGYFASNRPGGMGNDDLYGFRSGELPGLKTLVFQGQVVNSVSEEAIEKVAVEVLDPEGNRIKQAYTDEDGRYRIEIPARDSVLIKASKNPYSAFEESLGADRLATLNGEALNIGMPRLDDLVRETEGETVIKMDRFYFPPKTATITPEVTTELVKAVEAVRKFPELKLRIESHTDSRGSSTSNLKLSQDRANAIEKYLLGQGVPASAIVEAKGFGEQRIINNCKDGVYCLDMLHRQNERQLIVVQNYGELINED